MLNIYWGPALERQHRMNLPRTDQEQGGGGGGTSVQSCYTGPSVISSKMLMQAPTQSSKLGSSMRKVHYGLFDNAANQRSPGQLKLDDCTRPSPWGSLHVVFSLQADASHMPCCRTDCKVAQQMQYLQQVQYSADRLLSPILTYVLCPGLFIT